MNIAGIEMPANHWAAQLVNVTGRLPSGSEGNGSRRFRWQSLTPVSSATGRISADACLRTECRPHVVAACPCLPHSGNEQDGFRTVFFCFAQSACFVLLDRFFADGRIGVRKRLGPVMRATNARESSRPVSSRALQNFLHVHEAIHLGAFKAGIPDGFHLFEYRAFNAYGAPHDPFLERTFRELDDGAAASAPAPCRQNPANAVAASAALLMNVLRFMSRAHRLMAGMLPYVYEIGWCREWRSARSEVPSSSRGESGTSFSSRVQRLYPM
jgi:hypothetical protein